MARRLAVLCWIALAIGSVAFAADPLDILVLYDNTTTLPGAAADWGFSVLLTWRGEKILFDSGTKPDLLLRNMKALGVDPAGIAKAVISHAHGDHLNGIYSVFPSNRSMTVHFLDAFPPPAFTNAAAVGLTPRRVAKPAEIAPGVFTTGMVPGDPPEQALAVETAKGLVVITGCSHPGVTRMVEAVREQRGGRPVRLLLGGFHMLRDSEAEVRETIAKLKALGVEMAAPTHCTGESAIESFRKAYADRFQPAGVGKRFVLD